MKRYFCTYFDAHFLPRGLALIHSLARHCTDFKLWVLCMDDITYETLTQLALPKVVTIRLADFELGDDALVATKQDRSALEYCFTCTPSLPLYIFRHWSEPELITYLDADLFLYANPEPAFAEMGNHSIAIVGHRRPVHQRHGEAERGFYNVGWLFFRRDANGLACLQWWRERCLEWCYDKIEDGKHGDQKYLDNWPSRFAGVIVLEHKGVNTAPWNMSNYRFSISQDGGVFVDEQPLIAFHFSGLNQIRPWLYDLYQHQKFFFGDTILRYKVYGAYIRLFRALAQQLTVDFNLPLPCDDLHRQMPESGGYLSAQTIQVQLMRAQWRRLRAAARKFQAGHFMFYLCGQAI